MSADNSSLVPSFVLFQVGARRVALSQDRVAELIASPILFSFPHTSPLITGVVLRRGRIVPVLDLGPGLLGEPSPPARFFLVVERHFSIFPRGVQSLFKGNVNSWPESCSPRRDKKIL